MPDTMNALVLHGPEDLRLENLPVPEPGPGELLLRVTSAGICGSDAAFYRLGAAAQPPGTGVECPVVIGHEFAGEVVDLGDGAEGFAVGDLAVSGASVACLECPPCLAGNTNMCDRNKTAGMHRDGGLAEYCTIPAWSCVPATDHAILGDDAALVQPMSIAHHGVRRGRLAEGERALVIGVGGIGMFATWIASQTGAQVTSVDLDEARLTIAARLGADTVRLSPGQRLTDTFTPGSFDVIYEMSGVGEALEDAFALAGKSTRIVLVGLQKQPHTYNPALVVAREIELLGSAAQIRRSDLPAAADLVAARTEGWADVAPLVLPLGEVRDKGIVPMVERRAAAVKVLVDPRTRRERPYVR